MRDEVLRYTDGVTPELDPDLLVGEEISRSADFRDVLEALWGDLTDEERTAVRAADLVLVRSAARLAPFWRNDQTAYDREAEGIPQSRWWWWLDKIADGSLQAPEL